MKIDNKKVLVTGGAGMIGSHLVDALLIRDCTVTVLDNMSSGHTANLPKESAVHLYDLDIACDDGLDQVFEHDFDVVFHLAANFANRNSVDHPQRDLLTNGLGILKILDRCRKHDVKRFVYASSSCVYGNLGSQMSEDTSVFDPGTPYAMTKLLGEQYTQFYTEHHGMWTSVLRYFNCYGPREHPGMYRNVIPNFAYTALNKEPLSITGTGEETRDFCFVSDIVDGTILSAEYEGAAGQVFNISGGAPTGILDLAERINKLTENPAGVSIEGRRPWDHVVHRQPSTDKAHSLLQYSPAVSLDTGLEMTLDWMKLNWDHIHATFTR